MKEESKTLKVVHVIWYDPAFSRPGWLSLSQFKTFADSGLNRSDTVGFLSGECKEYIVVSQSLGESQVADSVKISRSAIKKMKVIKKIKI